MKTTNTQRDQLANELVHVLNINFRTGCNSPEFQQFSASYLTAKGARIAQEASKWLQCDDLLAIARRAVSAGY